MKIKIIALGKIKETYIKDGIEEFLKRLKPYAPIEIVEINPIEIKDENLITNILMQEGEKILSYINNNTYVITLEIEGKQLSSEDFSIKINELFNIGINELAFVIGSSHGIGKNVKERADYKLSFSKMTFLHTFARLILIEQIYRAFKILKHETYHK
ncbi:23S rRNA (pseudouridine(1915)-N(3))-methyltransferase RlmH [bacterium]|nr:23S rRNA (pseudouridine(1915)-N(3))-methyltransferase RlmH [bacterium]